MFTLINKRNSKLVWLMIYPYLSNENNNHYYSHEFLQKSQYK